MPHACSYGRLSTLLIESQEEVRSDLRSRKFAQIRSDRLSRLDQEMAQMETENRFPKTASGPESSFSLTRQAQTNRYDRRIDFRISAAARGGSDRGCAVVQPACSAHSFY
jgi:hypothetical protein